jgi:hypothetical protein
MSFGAILGSATTATYSTVNVFYRNDPYFYIGLGM